MFNGLLFIFFEGSIKNLKVRPKLFFENILKNASHLLINAENLHLSFFLSLQLNHDFFISHSKLVFAAVGGDGV